MDVDVSRPRGGGPVDGIDSAVPFYREAGSGLPMLFIHGAGGNSAIWWQQIAAFSPRNRTIAYDLPGFGRSPAPSPAGFADHFTQAGTAVLDAAGVEAATVVAQSLGGWSGLRLALDHPQKVTRLVLSCTMAGVDHLPALISFQTSLARMDVRGPASLALSDAFEDAEPFMAYLYAQVAAFNPTLDPTLGRRMFAPETLLPLSRLQEIACPVLLIAGELDPIWPPSALEGLAKRFRNGQMTVIPACGHSPYFEQPKLFNEIVRTFMTENLVSKES